MAVEGSSRLRLHKEDALVRGVTERAFSRGAAKRAFPRALSKRAFSRGATKRTFSRGTTERTFRSGTTFSRGISKRAFASGVTKRTSFSHRSSLDFFKMTQGKNTKGVARVGQVDHSLRWWIEDGSLRNAVQDSEVVVANRCSLRQMNRSGFPVGWRSRGRSSQNLPGHSVQRDGPCGKNKVNRRWTWPALSNDCRVTTLTPEFALRHRE